MNQNIFKDTEILILAGGKGTRLKDVIQDIPKPMALIAEKPFLYYLINNAKNQGFQNFRLLTGYKSEVIKNYFGFGTNFGVNINYTNESIPLGTGGSIELALTESKFNKFICLNGDSFININFKSFIDSAVKLQSYNQNICTIALKQIKNSDRYGTVDLNNKFIIQNFIEKQKSELALINAGVYYFTKDIIHYLIHGNNSIETDIFPTMTTLSLINGIPIIGRFIDIGIPSDYSHASSHLLNWIENDSYQPSNEEIFLERSFNDFLAQTT